MFTKLTTPINELSDNVKMCQKCDIRSDRQMISDGPNRKVYYEPELEAETVSVMKESNSGWNRTR